MIQSKSRVSFLPFWHSILPIHANTMFYVQRTWEFWFLMRHYCFPFWNSIINILFQVNGGFGCSWDNLSTVYLSTGLFIFPLEHYITLWHAMITMLSLGSGGVDSAWDNLISNGPPLYPWTLGWLMGMGGWTLELYQWYNPSTVLILLVRRRGC
jgi:hypothetical protein